MDGVVEFVVYREIITHFLLLMTLIIFGRKDFSQIRFTSWHSLNDCS
jgi:uncharacterized membrane protein YcaP (DUF421 family)